MSLNIDAIAVLADAVFVDFDFHFGSLMASGLLSRFSSLDCSGFLVAR